MSTATVSSPKKSQGKSSHAKWDEDKTKIIFEIFEEEINCGNRPSGVYSKQAWVNIVSKFNGKTGLNYNKEQIKNRQDNLRRDFTKWEALIGKETGLGWDNKKRTLSAPDSWWLEKAKTEPSILKYRDGGPVHLDLLQKVFGGTTANGFHAFIPMFSVPLTDHSDHVEIVGEEATPDVVEHLNEFIVEGFGEAQETTPTPTNGKSSSKLRCRKRARDSNGTRICQSDQITQTVGSLTETIRHNMETFKQSRMLEDTMSYTEAIELLKGLPGFTFDDDQFWKALRVLEDKTRRVAFKNILDGGVKAVTRWLNTFPDV